MSHTESGHPQCSDCGGDSTDDRGPGREDGSKGKLLEIRRGTRTGPALAVLVEVDGVSVEAIVDMGAEATLLSEAFYDSLSATAAESRGKGPKVWLHNAEDGATMEARRVEVRLQLGEFDNTWPVLVAPIREEVLLGLDVLQEADVEIRARGSIYALGKRVESQVISKGKSYLSSPVHLEKDLVLQPNTEHVAWGLVESPSPGKEAVLNPVRLPSGEVWVAASWVNMEARVPVRLANFAGREMRLKAGQLLGDLVETVPDEAPPRQEPRGEVETLPSKEACQARTADPLGLPEHLHDLFQRATCELGGQDTAKLARALADYKDVFAKNDLDLGRFSAVKHRIATGDARPIRQPVRRTPLGFQAEEEGHLQKMLHAGIVEPSQSEWASPVVLVRKKDGGVRWCINYRRLNDVTEKDAYPLPKIDECLDTLSGSSLISTLDLQAGYWQVEMAPEDKEKTAFITKYELFQHMRMSFGLCNAPGTFQRAMEVAMSGLQWKSLLVYIDDLIIISANLEEHLTQLAEVLDRLRQYGLKLKPKKCDLLQREVVFLGHLVNGDGIQTNPALVRDIAKRTAPRTLRELQAFLGLCNYYRRFVPGYARVAEPLNRLLAKKAKFEWGAPQQEAFEELKQCLTDSPTLAYPQAEGTFILDTDASDVSIGAVLSQEQEGKERVVAYASSQLEPAHQRYCVTRRELLAVVQFTRMFRHYLLGRKFILRTDHSSLTWLFRFKAPQGQLARWLEELSQYNFSIVHRAGKKHANADALSRLDVDDLDVCDCYRAGQEPHNLPCQGCSHCTKVHSQWQRFDDEVDYVVPLAVRCVVVRATGHEAGDERLSSWLATYTPAELRTAQKEDPDLCRLHQWKEDGRPEKHFMMVEGMALKRYWLCWPQIEERQGVLYYHWEGCGNDDTARLLVPRQLRESLLNHGHNVPTGGHFGVERTLARLRQKYYWQGMRGDVELYVAQCAECASTKKETRRRRASLQSYHAGCPMERVHLDILGPFPTSTQGNKYILVVMDQFTKWVEAYALPDQGAETTARALVYEFISRYGAPLTIHTDQGRNFESELFRRVCSLFEVTKTRMTPYHPASNGLVERFNRTLLQMLRSYVQLDQRDWDVHLPLLTAAYRATTHASTGLTPNKLMFGREVQMPGDIAMDPRLVGPDGDIPAFAADLTERLARLQELARGHLRQAQQRQKRDYDLRTYEEQYEQGDLIYLRDHQRRKGFSPKLQKVWTGPAVVIEKLGQVLYKVRGRRGTRVLHHDQLKPYRSADVPHWVSRFRATLELGATQVNAGSDEDYTVGGRLPQPSSRVMADEIGAGRLQPNVCDASNLNSTEGEIGDLAPGLEQ